MQIVPSTHHKNISHQITDGYKKIRMRNKIGHAQTAWLCYLLYYNFT